MCPPLSREFIVKIRPANMNGFCWVFFLNRGHEAPSLTGHRNWAIQAGVFNVAPHHNPMHSRAHKHVDQKGIINPVYSSTRLLNIHTVFHLFPFNKPPAHQANMVAIKLTLSRKHISYSHAAVFFSKLQSARPLI